MEALEHRIASKEELAAACMPFIKNGGLFIKTSAIYNLDDQLNISLKLIDEPTAITFTGKVVWITPKHEQNQLPEGIGVQFSEEESEKIRTYIKDILPEAFSNINLTDTM